MAKKGKNAVHLLKELAKDDPDFDRYYQEAHVNAMVAQLIYDVRKEKGLTQSELAKLVGTTQSVIAHLEDADYEGHSLSLLQRIAATLDKRVEINFVPAADNVPLQSEVR